MSDNWTVGKVSERSRVSVSTLHFYERKGLIKSDRNAGNQRRYRQDILRRVSVIKAAQKLGISLAEIEQAFLTLPNSRTPTQEDWQRLSAQWQQSLDARIAALTKLRDNLDGCIGCGCLSMKKCPLYNPDDKLAQKGSGPVLLEQSTHD